ncbi:MAG: AmmeMemoRadiSam system radical SAM enzyme [Eubacteriales bacterium]|nr:AmmeMemoRadiSam system radical SAM enzyme [Eubacteriales bacterium]
MKATCRICPRACEIEEGGLGFCRARTNRNGMVVCENYARVTAIALDPIEKKPLRQFHPGSKILSVGSYGCNMNCTFCQNCEISMARAEYVEWREIQPNELVARAEALIPAGNVGVAFTYNEPLVGYEYVLDSAKLAKERGLSVVLVTNGMICSDPWQKLLPYVDAANIDLKVFSREGYQKLGGDLDTVLETISIAAERIHVEVTTLVVPGLSDDETLLRNEAQWLAGESKGIALHLSRFFPRYRMKNAAPTPTETIGRLANIAREFLPFVYFGNC